MGTSTGELTMTEYEFECQECGHRFVSLTSRVGSQICPGCGGFDVGLAPGAIQLSVSADDRPDKSGPGQAAPSA